MGKLSKKLTVYLDQSIASAIVKREKNPEATYYFDLYRTLKVGFQDEKLIAPLSPAHKYESRFATHLEEELLKQFGQIGQSKLRGIEEIKIRQLQIAIEQYHGDKEKELDQGDIFQDNPDKRTQMFDIGVVFDYPVGELKKTKADMQERTEKLRTELEAQKIKYEEHLKLEIEAQKKQWALKDIQARIILEQSFTSPKEIKDFLDSSYFSEIPSVHIFCSLWARLLTNRTRHVEPGDDEDIKVIAAYLPYVDIFTADTFMATQIRELKLHDLYSTAVYAHKASELTMLAKKIEFHNSTTKPINTPALTIFVASDAEIKNNSWAFFQDLADQAVKAERKNGDWVELFAYDDGNMPKYKMKHIEELAPFTGLQDVQHLPLPQPVSWVNVLKNAKTTCRSPYFTVINKGPKPPADFISRALDLINKHPNKKIQYLDGFLLIKKPISD